MLACWVLTHFVLTCWVLTHWGFGAQYKGSVADLREQLVNAEAQLHASEQLGKEQNEEIVSKSADVSRLTEDVAIRDARIADLEAEVAAGGVLFPGSFLLECRARGLVLWVREWPGLVLGFDALSEH